MESTPLAVTDGPYYIALINKITTIMYTVFRRIFLYLCSPFLVVGVLRSHLTIIYRILCNQRKLEF